MKLPQEFDRDEAILGYEEAKRELVISLCDAKDRAIVMALSGEYKTPEEIANLLFASHKPRIDEVVSRLYEKYQMEFVTTIRLATKDI